jgi:hypothetical protein
LPDFFWRETNDSHAPIGGLAPLQWSKEAMISFMDAERLHDWYPPESQSEARHSRGQCGTPFSAFAIRERMKHDLDGVRIVTGDIAKPDIF